MSKKLFLLPALLLALAIGTMTTSCDKECKTDQNDFVGQWSVVEDCSNSVGQSYTATIVAGAADNEVLISTFYGPAGTGGFLAAVRATIDCDNITIARQEPDGDEFFVEGSGFRTKDGDRVTITWDYTVTNEIGGTVNDSDDCRSTVYTKL